MLKKLPKKIGITKLAALLDQTPDSSFWNEVSQHLLEKSFKAYISKPSIFAAYDNEDDEYSGGLTPEGVAVFPYDSASNIQLSDYCFNDDGALQGSVFYENDSILLLSFVLNNTTWYPCEGANLNPYHDEGFYEDALHSPLRIPFSDIKFDTQDVIVFFELDSEDSLDEPEANKSLSIGEQRANAFKFWLACQSEDEVKLMKKEEVWEILGDIDKRLFPTLGGESTSDFFTSVGFSFKRGRRPNK